MSDWLMKQEPVAPPAKGPVFRKESWRRCRTQLGRMALQLYGGAQSTTGDHVWMQLQLEGTQKSSMFKGQSGFDASIKPPH